MTEVLLKELTNSDIDWILATGKEKKLLLARSSSAKEHLLMLSTSCLMVH